MIQNLQLAAIQTVRFNIHKAILSGTQMKQMDIDRERTTSKKKTKQNNKKRNNIPKNSLMSKRNLALRKADVLVDNRVKKMVY